MIVVYMSAIMPSLFMSVVKLSLSSLLYCIPFLPFIFKFIFSAAGDPALFLG
jgi:hypothetical protein